MGVMNCNRKGCTTVMCDNYIENFGYICTDCKNEFREWLNNNPKIDDINGLSKDELQRQLRLFNLTSKGDDDIITFEEFFRPI